jgi:SAM-dependent methyltransferase
MAIQEFEDINCRQVWTNWRTVPKNLNGLLPYDRPHFAIDLCCGTGQSTEVLACYLPPGSQVLGIEQNPEFVRKARERAYLDGRGQPARARFRAQSALERFHDENGAELAEESVDVANSSGAIGHHFTPDMTLLMMREISRVLKPGGLALIDSGPWGTSTSRVRSIGEALGWQVLRENRSRLLDPLIQVAFQKPKRE